MKLTAVLDTLVSATLACAALLPTWAISDHHVVASTAAPRGSPDVPGLTK